MSERPTPTPRSAQLVFGFAHHLTPKNERVWLAEMGLEYAFVRGRRARLWWLLGMVGLALRLRVESLSWGKPKYLWAASLGLSALFVALVVTCAPLRLTAGLEKAETYKAATNPAEPSPTGPKTAEAAQEAFIPGADTNLSRAAAPAPSLAMPQEADAPKPAPAETESVETATPKALPSEATTTDAATADSATADSATADSAPATVEGTAEATATDAIVTRVASETVTLRLTGTAWLELRQGTADGPVLQEGTFQAGQTFSVTVPFYLGTSNAGGVSVQAGAANLGDLGRAGEQQTRLFVKP